MCGICGKLALKPFDSEIITRMKKALAHRGPDAEGTYYKVSSHFTIGLGHTRLAIIDLSPSGNQPMTNEDGTIIGVVNGEIYNYTTLKKMLTQKGHLFKSNSDSEVILHGYEEWGAELLVKIKGMFAFAIWDQNVSRLFLARDYYGEKPLYYTYANGEITFASELPALLTDPSLSPRIDRKSFLTYLHYQVVCAPRTILADVRKVAPGHYVVVEKNSIHIKAFVPSGIKAAMAVDEKERRPSLDEGARELQEALLRSARNLTLADVPVGIFLSGGLDSSLILATYHQNASRRIHSFSIGFDHQEFNELPWARMMARKFNTRHHEAVVKMDILSILPLLIRHLGEPMADASIIPYYYLAQLAASKVKVVIGGDGADELWGGYRRYMLHPYTRLLAAMRPLMAMLDPLYRVKDGYYANHYFESLRLAVALGRAQKKGYTPWNPLFDLDEIAMLVSKDCWSAIADLPVSFKAPGRSFGNRKGHTDWRLWIDQRTFLPEDILTKVDRMSMAHSLEVRAPYLYPDIAALSFSVPAHFKVFLNERKRVLKRSGRHLLPRAILKRRKHGFNVPVDAWFRQEGAMLFRESVIRGHLVQEGWLNPDYLIYLHAAHAKRYRNFGRQLWGLLVLELWYRIFVAGRKEEWRAIPDQGTLFKSVTGDRPFHSPK